jgi:predicted small lipoprotein YifL
MIWTFIRICLLIVILVLLAGCGSKPTALPTANEQASPEPQDTGFVSVLPTPTTFPSILPSPDPSWTTVIGTALGAQSQSPVVSTSVFLERTPDTQTVPLVLYAPPNDQPQTTTDANGNFTITGVPDGNYVIVFFSPPLDPRVAKDPSTGNPIFVTAEAGKVIQVGPISVPDF